MQTMRREQQINLDSARINVQGQILATDLGTIWFQIAVNVQIKSLR